MLTKKLNVGEILKKENITITENSHYVLTYGEVDLDAVDENFSFGNYKVKSLKNKLSNIEIDFSVYKDDKLILDCVSDKDVRKYIQKILKNYKGYRYWGAKMLEKYKEDMVKGIEFEKSNKFFQEYDDEECIIGLLTDIIRRGVSNEVLVAKSKLRPCLALLTIVNKNLDYKLLIEKTDNTKEKVDLVYFSISTLAMVREKNYTVAFINILQMLYSLGLDDDNFLFSDFEDKIIEDYVTIRTYDPNSHIEASIDSVIFNFFNLEDRDDFNKSSLEDKLNFFCVISSIWCAYEITDSNIVNITELSKSVIKDYYPLLTNPLNLMLEKDLEKDRKGHYILFNLFGKNVDVSKYLYAYYYRNIWSIYDYPPTFKEFVENNLSSKEFAKSFVGKII